MDWVLRSPLLALVSISVIISVHIGVSQRGLNTLAVLSSQTVGGQRQGLASVGVKLASNSTSGFNLRFKRMCKHFYLPEDHWHQHLGQDSGVEH